MRPIRAIPSEWASALDGVAFDLDDTMLDRGRLLPEALAILYRARRQGLELYAVTGRPASWGAVITHQWPLNGAITENGAIGFVREDDRIVCVDWAGVQARRERRSRLEAIVAELLRRHPEVDPADDVSGRISDFTFDVGEHRKLPPELVARVRASAVELGASTSLSSVHLHVSLDRADKASGVVRLVQGATGRDPSRILSRLAYLGDSENDASCFAAFRVTVGMKNLTGRPTLPPRFSTHGERAAGFVEALEVLLERQAIDQA